MSAPYSCVRDMLFELKTTDQNSNSPDVFQALSYVKQASQIFDQEIGIPLTPRLETRQYDVRSWHIDSNKNWLLLPAHLFSVSEVTDGNGVALDPAVWFTEPVGVIPFHTIQLISRSAINPFGGAALSFYTTVNPQYYGQSNTKVTGVWGWHPDYANALSDSLDTVQDDPLSANSSYITVSDIENNDVYGRFPRFSPGQLLSIGGTEYVEVTMTNPSSNKLLVLRGQAGTTKCVHEKEEQILIWEPPTDVVRAVARFACFPYKRRGDFAYRAFDTAANSSRALPPSIPSDILAQLQRYSQGVPDGGWLRDTTW